MRLLPRVLVRLHAVEKPQHTWLTSLVRRLRRLAGSAALRRYLNARESPSLGPAAGDTGEPPSVMTRRCRDRGYAYGRTQIQYQPRARCRRHVGTSGTQRHALHAVSTRAWRIEGGNAAGGTTACFPLSSSSPIGREGGLFHTAREAARIKKPQPGRSGSAHTRCRPFPSKGRLSAM
jgi:hypothetical protein